MRMPVAFCSPVPISLMSTPYHRLPLVWDAADMKDSMVGVRLAFRGTMPPRRKSLMLRRTLLASAAAFAGPVLVAPLLAPFVARTALGQKARTVRMGTA